jgi:hypothetical protein
MGSDGNPIIVLARLGNNLTDRSTEVSYLRISWEATVSCKVSTRAEEDIVEIR